MKQLVGRRGQARAFAAVGGASDVIEKTEHFFEEITCDVSQLVGPYACLHNEHGEILRTLDKVTANQAVLADQIAAAHEKLDRIMAFLDSKFEGSP